MINSTINPISYKEAATMLSTSPNHIADSVSRGLLTRIPTIGLKQAVIKEQVSLFVGKKQIRLSMLSSDELSLWTHYKDLAENNNAPTNELLTDEQVGRIVASTMHQYNLMTDEEKKRHSMILSVVGAILVLALGLNWFIDHREQIVTLLVEYNKYVTDINKKHLEKVINSVKELGENADTDIIIKTVIDEIAA